MIEYQFFVTVDQKTLTGLVEIPNYLRYLKVMFFFYL